jgi:DNA-binding transcriptional ArsR family regulator
VTEDASGLPGPDRRQKRPVAVLDAFERNYPRVQYHCVQFLSEHLADCARTFSGDLTKVLVLAVLGQRYIETQISDQRDQRDKAAGQPSAMSASRIADVTGLSRETVRRKLDALSDLGWVEQGPDRRWQISKVEGATTLRDDLKDLDSRGLQRLARLYAALTPLSD